MGTKCFLILLRRPITCGICLHLSLFLLNVHQASTLGVISFAELGFSVSDIRFDVILLLTVQSQIYGGANGWCLCHSAGPTLLVNSLIPSHPVGISALYMGVSL